MISVLLFLLLPLQGFGFLSFSPTPASVSSIALRSTASPEEVAKKSNEGKLEVTSLEGNTWVFKLANVTVLLDPILDVLEWKGVKVVKNVMTNYKSDVDNPALRQLAASTDVVAITQGIEDHVHEETLAPLSKLLAPGTPVVAPPSAKEKLDKYFTAEQVRYISPGQQVTLSTPKGAVEILAAKGSQLGPPWKQHENAYLMRGEGCAESWDLFTEPHCNYSARELSKLRADVIVAPVVEERLLGFYTLVQGGDAAVKLAKLLHSKVFITGLDWWPEVTRTVLKSVGTVEGFGAKAEARGIKFIRPHPGEPVRF
ncbi:unnamed protein product [Chrysoparadoxa australica]